MTMRSEADEVFLTARQVRARYGGRSDMWLWRLLRDEPEFPRPTYLREHRYWKVSDLLEWERSRSPKKEAA